MAAYKIQQNMHHSTDPAFDVPHRPGQSAPFAGIYRCAGCGHEIGIAEGHTLPAQNHAQHTASLGPILWKLQVFAQHNE